MSRATLRSAPRAKVTVTGGAGFVGSHLVDRLRAEGAEVLVIDDMSTGRAGNLPVDARVEQLDIAAADLTPLFRSWRPAIVFHLAAQANVVFSQQDPLRDLAVNVIGTHRVATASRQTGVRKLIFVSSGGAVYGETHRAATERTLPAPSSYYGVHKLAAEGHVLLAGLPSAVARPSNIYGPRQSAGLEGAVVAAFVNQAREGRLSIHGDGSQTRDFVHVRDVTDALWRLGRQSAPTGIWNVAAGRRTAIMELADAIERACGGTLGRTHGPRRPGDVTSSVISGRRLRELGWRPEVTLEAGIAELLQEASLARTGRP
jgi:nucleoside-diphosphate-sugar epimerase